MSRVTRNIEPSSYTISVEEGVNSIVIPYKVIDTVLCDCDKKMYVTKSEETVYLPDEPCATSTTVDTYTGSVITSIEGQEIAYTITRPRSICPCDDTMTRRTSRYVSHEVNPYVIPWDTTASTCYVTFDIDYTNECGESTVIPKVLSSTISGWGENDTCHDRIVTTTITIGSKNLECNVLQLKSPDCTGCTSSETYSIDSILYDPPIVPYSGSNVNVSYRIIKSVTGEDCKKTRVVYDNSFVWAVSGRNDGIPERCNDIQRTSEHEDSITHVMVPLSITQARTPNYETDCAGVCDSLWTKYAVDCEPYMIEYWCKHMQISSHTVSDMHGIIEHEEVNIESWYGWGAATYGGSLFCNQEINEEHEERPGGGIVINDMIETRWRPYVNEDGGKIRLTFQYTAYTNSIDCFNVTERTGETSVEVTVPPVDCNGSHEGSVICNANNCMCFDDGVESVELVSGSVNHNTDYQIQYKDEWTGECPARSGCHTLPNNVLKYDYMQVFNCQKKRCDYNNLSVNDEGLDCDGGMVRATLS